MNGRFKRRNTESFKGVNRSIFIHHFPYLFLHYIGKLRLIYEAGRHEEREGRVKYGDVDGSFRKTIHTSLVTQLRRKL